MIRVVLAPLSLLLLLALLVACGDPDDRTASVAAPTKNGSGELRRDLDPLVERWPVLAGATSATWMSGTRGDDEVPGPSTYWIDAVVTLDPATYDELAATTGLAPATTDPGVVPGLAGSLPDGSLLAGPSLDTVFTVGDWRATAYLSPDARAVVLVGLGE